MKTKLLFLLVSSAAFGFATFHGTEYWITRHARLHAPESLELGHQDAGARVAPPSKSETKAERPWFSTTLRQVADASRLE